VDPEVEQDLVETEENQLMVAILVEDDLEDLVAVLSTETEDLVGLVAAILAEVAVSAAV